MHCDIIRDYYVFKVPDLFNMYNLLLVKKLTSNYSLGSTDIYTSKIKISQSKFVFSRAHRLYISMYFLPRIYSDIKIESYLFQKLKHINLVTIGRFGHMLKTYFLDLHSLWEHTWRCIGPIGLF